MGNLESLAEKFISPGVFQGATVGEQLQSGYLITKAILEKYGIDTNVPLADPPADTMAMISAIEANQGKAEYILGSFASLTDALSPDKDPPILQAKAGSFFQSMLWAWRSTAAGVPIYASGYDAVLAASGNPQFSPAALAEDARRRLLVFQAIVASDQVGLLANAHFADEKGISMGAKLRGLHGPEIIAAIPIGWIAIGAIAVVVIFWIAWTGYQNSKTFDKNCERAAELGYKDLVADCIKAGMKPDPFQALLEKLFYVGGAVVLGYLLITYALPQLITQRASSRALPAWPLAKALLPSASSARALVSGDVSAVPMVLAHMALRAGLIYAGMYAMGVRENLVRAAIGGSFGIEVFVLAWEYNQRDA